MIDLCNGCNHECVFCMNRFMTRKVTRMKPSLYTKIIDQAQNLGVEELGLYATGEPFMHTRLEDFVKEAKDKKGKTPLHYAAQNENEPVVRLLIDLGADKEAKNKDSNTRYNS